jgi:branched-chain amino acid transport system substrate-binding protein
MRTGTRVCAISLSILCTGAVAACGSGSATSTTVSSKGNAPGSGGPFTLLWVGAATGPSNLYGLGQLHAMKEAVAYINSHGGMAGHQIKLVLKDDGSDPTNAVSGLLSYVASHGPPDAVWAGSESNETGALLPVLAQRKIFGYAQTDGPRLLRADASAKFPYEFDPSPTPSLIDLAAASWLKEKHFHKVGILQEQLDYTTSETPLLAGYLRKEGISDTVATFAPTLTDVTPEVSELKSAGADVVFAEALGPAAGYTLAARAKLGWNVPVLGDGAFSSNDVTKLVPASDLTQLYLLESGRGASASAHYPALDLFKSYMDKTGGIGADGIGSEAAAWDATMTVYTAARQAGATTPAALANALEHMRSPVQPYYVNERAEAFSSTDHENVDAKAADNTVLPVGPLVDGQVK